MSVSLVLQGIDGFYGRSKVLYVAIKNEIKIADNHDYNRFNYPQVILFKPLIFQSKHQIEFLKN